ncbi:penicillin acylase family protein [bacterium]|nr:penicillin acylase family protein [bacterium]
MLKKILVTISIIILVIVVIVLFLIRGIATKGIPDYNAKIQLDNLKEEVTVYRDEFAVPHIYAKNEEDLYRATGYCMAQDRLWQFDLIRRATTGQLSEIFGEDMIDADQMLRMLRIPEKSKSILENADDEIINTLNAFCDGVNQYIDTHQKNLPPEFSILGYKPDKWLPEHSINLIGYMAWDLTMPWHIETVFQRIREKVGDDKFAKLVPDLDLQKSVVYTEIGENESVLSTDSPYLAAMDKLEGLGLEIFNGSNNWVVSGAKSTSGKPLFANDMHLGLSAPGIWYTMHQVVEGKFNVTGVAVPGQPLIVAGHNEYIAWGMTNVMVDDMDFYYEKINPDNPDEYWFNGEWKPLDVRKEIIKIKGGETVERVNRFTHRGPIVTKNKKMDEDKPISMRWVGNEPSDEMRSLYLMNRARNWEDYKNALKTFIAVSQNIAYADVDGNIGIYCAAGVPIRDGWNGLEIVPGETDKYDWLGLVPFEKLPHSYNPKSGFVSSANNRSAGDDYPYHISHWYAPQYRIDRIREMLTEKALLSIDDYKRMQGDHKSKLVEKMIDRVNYVVDNIDNLNDIEKQSTNLLAEWDGILTKESIATTIFDQFYLELIRNIFLDELGEDLFADYTKVEYTPYLAIDKMWLDGNSEWCDDISTEVIENLEDVISQSFKDAIAELSNRFGTDIEDWQWGKVHGLLLEHPMGGVKLLDKVFNLNRGPYPVGGGSHTVSPYRYDRNNPFTVNYGASHRHIYDTSDWDKSISIIPTGISGIPASKHYCDQTQSYVDNEYRNDYISRDLVEESAKYKQVFTK